VGIESTIVDVTSKRATILRPGSVTREQLNDALKTFVPLHDGGPVRSPGQHASHYAPRAEVELATAEELVSRAQALLKEGRKVAALTAAPASSLPPTVERITVPPGPNAFARTLYTALRKADAKNVDVILVVPPPDEGVGLAIGDRLKKAAGPRGTQILQHKATKILNGKQ